MGISLSSKQQGDIDATIIGFGAGVIATVAIDQTTPGATNKVAIRTNAAGTATILNTANLSEEIDFREYTMMVIHMPAAWTAAFIGFHVSTTTGGTFLPLFDEHGNYVQTATAVISTAISAPAELAGCRFVKLWSQDGAGANVAQGAERTLLLDLKA